MSPCCYTYNMNCKNCARPVKRTVKGVCPRCYQQRWAAANAARQKALEKGWRAANQLRNRGYEAKRRNLEFTLVSLPQIPEVCPVFGLPFGGNIGGPSLDRVDNSKGYVPGNVQWISTRANRLKSNATAAELVAIVNYMLKHELLS